MRSRLSSANQTVEVVRVAGIQQEMVHLSPLLADVNFELTLPAVS